MRNDWKKVIVVLGMFLMVFKGNLFSQSEGPEIVWQENSSKIISTYFGEGLPLAQAIQQFMNRFVLSSEPIVVHPSVVGNVSGPSFRGISAQMAFEWLLSEHELILIQKGENWIVLKKQEAWHWLPYHRLVSSPVPLSDILEEMEQLGFIRFMYEEKQIKEIKVHNNLHYASVEEGVYDLAHRFDFFVKYRAESHSVNWTASEEIQVRHLMLKNVTQIQMEAFLEANAHFFQELKHISLHFIDEQWLVLKGPEPFLSNAFATLLEFDTQQNLSLDTKAFHLELIQLKALTQEEAEEYFQQMGKYDPAFLKSHTRQWGTESGKGFRSLTVFGERSVVEQVVEVLSKLDQNHAENQRPHVERIKLNYLQVGTKEILSGGQLVTVEGVETRLQQIFSQSFSSEEGEGPVPLQVIPDFIGNALLLRGSEAKVQLAKEFLEQWDKPQPQIRIEAHIFETSESVSRELGIQFGARGIPSGGTEANVENVGIFSAGAVLGPLGTTKAFQVDTLLRFMESKGQGRVLSRPVVTTINQIEAVMRSGDVINVKVIIDNKPSLKEIETGVTLRVTPRLIESPSEGGTSHQIRLKVFAESSTPIQEAATDGIPLLNTQTAHSEVVVPSGEPFLLGGLIRHNSGEAESGVPFLKDLPILGNLFKIESNSNRFNHVLVFVTPTLVSEEEETSSFPVLKNLPKIEELDGFSDP